MAKKKNKIRESTIENYYDLKVDKVDELVAALKEEPPADSNDLSMFISDCTGGILLKTIRERERKNSSTLIK